VNKFQIVRSLGEARELSGKTCNVQYYSDVVQWFKSATTRCHAKLRRINNTAVFAFYDNTAMSCSGIVS